MRPLPSTLQLLNWAYQSTVLSNIKPKSSFLTTLFMGGREEYLPTEVAELSYIEGHEQMAPYVEVNAEAITVPGHSVRFANVSTPNIRIKRPMEAYNVFLRRQPGTGLFIAGGDVVARARQAAINEDLTTLNDMIERRMEWSVSQLLTGRTSGFMELSYSVEEKANWKVSIPRSSTMVTSAGTSWATATNVAGDFHKAKRAMARYQRLAPQVCVMGADAADAFMANPSVRSTLDTKNVRAGAITLEEQFTEAGAIYLGRFAGIECWEYSAVYTNDAGSSVPYVPVDQAIFLHTSPANEAKMLYGAIPDHDAFEMGNFIGKRFGKAWKENDPSVLVHLAQSRPLPIIRRPGSVYNLDAV